MNTSIDHTILLNIQQHLESAYPYEACGFLLGSEGASKRVITSSLEVKNESTDNQRRRFVINPLDYLKAERFAAKEGLALLGIYHSHPDQPAIPSIHDLEYAQPYFSYFIFSIYSGKLKDTHNYRLSEGEFIEESFSVIPASKPRSPELKPRNLNQILANLLYTRQWVKG